MKKPKGAAKQLPKGQSTLFSFIKGSKKSEPETSSADEVLDIDSDVVETLTLASEPETPAATDTETVAEEENDEEAGSGEEMDEDDEDKPGKKANGLVKNTAPDSSELPPINEIPAIFADLVSRAEGLKEVAEHIKGRKLRVATMCSGTESPLLALELIQDALEAQEGIRLEVEHVFSCEIEPFKQAYIERNFHPPILFRDVCELGDGKA